MFRSRDSKNLTVHGLEECPCGCGRAVPKGRNRNGIKRRFFGDQCRAAMDRAARQAGRRIIERGIPLDALIIEDKRLRAARRKRQESIDLDRMKPGARLAALRRAARGLL